MARRLACRAVTLAVIGLLLLPAPTELCAAQSGAVDTATLRRVFPEASDIGPFGGTPPSAPAMAGTRVIGFVFSTRQTIGSTGYSQRPIDVLVGIDLLGRLTGAAILQHQEPILVIGVSDADLAKFVQQYRGRDIREPVRIERGAPVGKDSISAVSGATVSSIVIGDAILRAARVVARARGILQDGAAPADRERFAPADWQALLSDGSLRRLTLSVADLQAALMRRGLDYFAGGAVAPGPGETFLDLYAALATSARVGRNLLGDALYNRILGDVKAGDQLLFVAGRGLYSFKGTDYRNSGRFERIQIVQAERTITLRSDDYVRIDALPIEGRPDLREIAVFVLHETTGFQPDRPWRLDVAVSPPSAGAGATPTVFSLDGSLVARADAPTQSITAAADASWVPIWRSRAFDVAMLLGALLVLSAVLFFQDALAQRARLYQTVRIGFLLFTLLWIGWYSSAQLSVINVITFAEALRTEFRWEFFLLEPLVFILWGYVAVTMIFWGRGVFCGWLCPFGALQELSNKAARRLRVPQITIPFGLHERLWPIKYVLFVCLFGLSLGGVTAVQGMVEVEPFKTAMVLKFDRAWPYVMYVVVLLTIGLFVERFFCRYFCPLGAALAIPARIRMFEWLKRRWQCGLQCHICARSCPVQAIHPEGRINPNECIHCLNCQVLYYDDNTCPPLVERRKRKDPQLDQRLIKRFADAEREGSAPSGNPKGA